jgi:hypothetical protein
MFPNLRVRIGIGGTSPGVFPTFLLEIKDGVAFSALSLFSFFCQRLALRCPGRGAAPLGGAPQSRDLPWDRLDPGARVTPRRAASATSLFSLQELSWLVRSLQPGLDSSINLIFQARRHRLRECSRARASRMESNNSKWTSRSTSYFFVKPGTSLALCSDIRRARLFVTPT